MLWKVALGVRSVGSILLLASSLGVLLCVVSVAAVAAAARVVATLCLLCLAVLRLVAAVARVVAVVVVGDLVMALLSLLLCLLLCKAYVIVCSGQFCAAAVYHSLFTLISLRWMPREINGDSNRNTETGDCNLQHQRASICCRLSGFCLFANTPWQ